MKKIIVSLSVIALFLLIGINSKATPTMILGSLATVNGTTNTSATYALTYNPTLQQFSVTHGVLTSTNEMAITLNVGVNGTNNGVAVGTWYPSTTNAATEIIQPGQYSITNYVYATVVTTNAVSVGGTYGL